MNVLVELCRVRTADGLRLDGAFYPPRPAAADHPALLLIHGTGSNFYGSGILASVADQAVADEFPVLRVNTRGHDLIASIPGPQGPVRGGAAYERVADASLDITAWTDWLVARGVPRVVLIGHSLGGVKAIWSQVQSPHPAVCGVIGLNPPRFVHARFQADPRCDAFRRDFVTAQQLVQAGHGDTLLTVTQPLPIVITAAGYLEKYGPDDPLDYLPVLPHVSCPHLIILGNQLVETNPAFNGLPAALAKLAEEDPQLRLEFLDGADINFRNDPADSWRRIRRWLASARQGDKA
jgi:pimeloyl-ACP methyl ester carboxylesterase